MSPDDLSSASDLALQGLVITPASFIFPQVKRGQMGQRETFTITNYGPDATAAVGAATTKSNSFMITSDGCQGLALAVGSSCSVSVQFNAVNTGKAAATLSLGTLNAPIQGYGIGTWKNITPTFSSTLVFTGLFVQTNGINTTGVWATTTNAGVWQSSGTTDTDWQQRDTIATPSPVLTAIWGDASGNIWVVGSSGNKATAWYFYGGGGVTNFNGGGQALGMDNGFSALSGNSETNLWGCGASNAKTPYAHHTQIGGAWTAESSASESPPTTANNGIWVAPNGKVFAVGSDGISERDLNGKWDTLSQQFCCLNGIWGVSDSDFYITGDTKILHYDGSALSMGAQTTSAMTAVWGSGNDDVFVVGRNGVIYHSNGGNIWETQDSGTTAALNAVWGLGTSSVYAAGEGVLLHYQ